MYWKHFNKAFAKGIGVCENKIRLRHSIVIDSTTYKYIREGTVAQL